MTILTLQNRPLQPTEQTAGERFCRVTFEAQSIQAGMEWTDDPKDSVLETFE